MKDSPMFGSDYAALYDAVYAGKDYDRECSIIDAAIEAHSRAGSRRILDLGCGTAQHGVRLAQRGYEVTGVDRSSEMVRHARQRAQAVGVDIELQLGDLRTVQFAHRFDAVLMMFAVMGYQYSNDDLWATWDAVRAHLAPGGVLVFDVWFGPAVLHQRPETRVATLDVDDGRILRVSSATLDVRTHTCDVDIHLWQLREDRIESETNEMHRMRFFFEQELRLIARATGFELVELSAFPEVDRRPSLETWNVLGVARAAA